MRTIIRQLVPKTILISYQLSKRYFSEHKRHFAFRREYTKKLPFQISVQQFFMPSVLAENKIHNITLGTLAIHKVIVEPNEVLSFWKCVKKPNLQKGFKVGRNLINGKVSEDYGGGLCQLSSILYHCALMAGLVIIERHHHSVDIYQEQERFTPLGADATVVYGYKDLQIQNPYPFSITFAFDITSKELYCTLLSEEYIEPKVIRFEREYIKNQILVTTLEEQGGVIATSTYFCKI
jgi:vancomycin resistance protein VanW